MQLRAVLDLDAMWRRQVVPDPLMRALLIAAAEAARVITSPPAGVRNMSEWAKKQACWAELKAVTLSYDDDFDTCTTSPEDAKAETRKGRTEKVIVDGINAQTEVVKLGGPFWQEVLSWGRENKRLSPKESQILEICGSMPRRIPKDYESKMAMSVLDRLKAGGLDF